VQPTQGGEVADGGGRQFRAGGEVELLEGGGLVEAGPAQPPSDRGGVAAADLVVAQDLQELEVAKFPGAGLGQAGVEGVQHAGQLQRAQAVVQGGVDHAHRVVSWS
jgi:hypothetical protein